MMMETFLYILPVLLLFYIAVFVGRNWFLALHIVRKRRKESPMIPSEMIKDFIGKTCSISLFNETFGITGKIQAVEDNWLKVQEKDTCRLVNGDMVRDIRMLPQKYQK